MTKTSFERSVQSKEEKQQIESVAMKRIVVKRKRKGINGYFVPIAELPQGNSNTRGR